MSFASKTYPKTQDYPYQQPRIDAEGVELVEARQHPQLVALLVALHADFAHLGIFLGSLGGGTEKGGKQLEILREQPTTVLLGNFATTLF